MVSRLLSAYIWSFLDLTFFLLFPTTLKGKFPYFWEKNVAPKCFKRNIFLARNLERSPDMISSVAPAGWNGVQWSSQPLSCLQALETQNA